MKKSIRELTEGMQRLCAVANRIVSHGGNVSRIERDLLLEDLRRLYEVALRMEETENGEGDMKNEEQKTEHETEVMPDEEMLSSTVMAARAAMGMENEEKEKQATEKEEPVLLEAEPEPVLEPEPEETPKPEVILESEPMPEMESLEANDNALLFDEVIIEPEETENEKMRVESENEKREQKQVAGTQASLLDYLHAPQSLHESVPNLGEQLSPAVRTLGENLSNKVSDLRTVININDKFSFMSELFHNNMKAYNDFILRLNAIDTRDEALLCVNEVSAQYHWDESSVAVQSFYKVFDKKF